MVIAQPMTREPLRAFSWLRSVDWPHSNSVSPLVYDGRDVYTLVAEKQISEKATAGGHSYDASRFGLSLEQGGQKIDPYRFTLWIDTDAAHTLLREVVEDNS